MTDRLETVLEKISTVPNPVNSSLMQEFYQFMVYNRKSIAIRRTTTFVLKNMVFVIGEP